MRSMDFMGGEFALEYSTLTGRHQTVLGGYTTVLLGLFVLISSLVIIPEYFDSNNPIVTSTIEFNSNDQTFDLYKEEFIVPISIMTDPTIMPAKQALRYITPVIEIEEHSFNPKTKNLEFRKLYSFRYIPCDEINDELIQKFIKNTKSPVYAILKNNLCPDFGDNKDQFKAVRGFSRSTHRIPKLKIYPCSLTNKSQCASAEEINGVQVLFPSISKILISSNFTHPVSKFLENKGIVLDPSVRKMHRNEVRLNRIEDHTSAIWGPRIKAEYVTQEKTESDYAKRDEGVLHCEQALIEVGKYGACPEYAFYEYSPSTKILKVRRNYKKITTVLGELGGFTKLVTVVVFFFVFLLQFLECSEVYYRESVQFRVLFKI